MLLFETYTSQKELEKITNLIVKKISKETYELHKKASEIKRIRKGILVDVKFKDSEYSDGTYRYEGQLGDSIMLAGIGHFKKNDIEIKYSPKNDNVFEHISGIYATPDTINYKGDLKRFLGDMNLMISVITKDEEDTTQASYFPLIRQIELYINEDFFKKLSVEKRNSNNFSETTMYMILYYELYSSLLHELQHAYDDYRSKGKSLKKSDIINTNVKIKHLNKKPKDSLTDEEIELLNKHSKNYLNSQHEINARFAQAIKNIHFVNLIDFNEDGSLIQEMYPLEEVIKEFKRNFYGYRFLPERAKKKLIRKVSQFWHYEKDVIEK